MKPINRLMNQLCSRPAKVIAVQIFFALILCTATAFVVVQVVWFTFFRKPDFIFTARPAQQLQQLISPVPTPNESEIWLGGDSATSIPLIGESSKAIWLFGDTLVGSYPTVQSRREVRYFIHNTVGLLDGVTRMKFSWKLKGSTPHEIFRPVNSSEYYWVMVGASLAEDVLLLSASRIYGTVDYFASTGTTFLIVSNPIDPPDQWLYTSYDIPETGDTYHLDWTTAITTKDDWVYIFGRAGTGFNTYSVLSKIRVSDVKLHNWHNMEYWAYSTSVSTAPGWVTSGSSYNRLAPLATLPGNPEGTIQWNDYMNSWFMLNIEFGSFEIKIYRAEALTGPWIGGEVVYSIPSPWSTAPKEEDITVYAVKSHPELTGQPDQIVLSYNVNTWSGNFFHLLDKYSDFYVPQCVHVTIARSQ